MLSDSVRLSAEAAQNAILNLNKMCITMSISLSPVWEQAK